ncbi:MAG: hypothetical protein ACD_67C00231G0004 [uncultured bacterium]|nr:MAG: hypothetical protein ACD_67C00231G0004 [uncultured bacterium]
MPNESSLSREILQMRKKERETFARGGGGMEYYKPRLADYDNFVETLDRNYNLLDKCVCTFKEMDIILVEPEDYTVNVHSFNGSRFAHACLAKDLVGVQIKANAEHFEFRVFLKDKGRDLVTALWNKVIGGDVSDYIRADREKDRPAIEEEITKMVPVIAKAIRRFEEKLPAVLAKANETQETIKKINDKKDVEIANVLEVALANI